MRRYSPFQTDWGRLLDFFSGYPQLRPYVKPVRRLSRKVWLMVARNPHQSVFLRYVTLKRLGCGLAAILIFLLGGVVADKIDEIHRHRLEADIRRVSNLQQIRLDVKQFHLKRGRLPDSLAELQSDHSDPHYIRDDHFYDPESLSVIEYKKLSGDEYSLCSSFRFTSKVIAAEVPDSGADGPIWRHNAGYHCFGFAVSTNQSDSESQ